MIKIHCDRCGKEIKGTTYYTISIHADDINPSLDYSKSLTTALQNFKTNSSALFKTEKQYCRKCIDKIENFINNKE